MNFVLNFCRITGASRIFSRNFYLPLLKPATPKDALRTFRITGRWLLGSKTQHYIPVLLNHEEKRKLNELKRKNRKKDDDLHEIVDDYNYLIPILDPNNEQHRTLLTILEQKNNNDDTFYVYTVDDKRCNVVLNGQFELAIRDGDVIDVVVSQRNDKLLVKLKNFKKVPIEMNNFDCFNEDADAAAFYCGEGATSIEEEKFHHHGKFIMSIAKIFEDKEREAEEWELELKRIIEKRIKKAFEATKEYNEILMTNSNALDWRKYEKDCKKVVDQISEPIVEHHIGMVVENLDKTKDVAKIINHAELLHYLPTMAEIPDVINSFPNATYHELETQNDRISGVKLRLPSGKECFVSGQMVQTEDGDVFVPGQTIDNEFGSEYAPGITVNLNDEVTLVNGLIVGEENNGKPMFCPTDSAITSEGQLTFTTTKEERVKYKPRKPLKEVGKLEVEAVVPKKVKKKSKKKREVAVEAEKPVEVEEIVEIVPVETSLTENEPEDDQNVSSNYDAASRDSVSLELDQRQELEQLRRELLDDGLDEIVAGLEEKTGSLRQKLEELRKIKVCLTENAHITYINAKIALDYAQTITNEAQATNRLAEILTTITRRCCSFRNRKSIKQQNVNNNTSICNGNTAILKTILKEAMVEANETLKKHPKDQVSALKALSCVLKNKLNAATIEELFNNAANSYETNELISLLLKELTVDLNENKYEMLKSIRNDHLDDEAIVERIEKILEAHGGSLMADAATKLAKTTDDYFNRTVALLKNKQMNRLKTETDVIELLQTSLVTVAKQLTSEQYERLITSPNNHEARECLLSVATALSLLLDRSDIYENLRNLPELTTHNLNNTTRDFLQRAILIIRLAENDAASQKGLERLKLQPEEARTDKRLLTLIKETSILTTESSPLNNSKDVPLKYLKNENLLAIEDYLIKRRVYSRPIMLCKKGYQAILPKGSSPAVLAGRVSYVLIDENGNGTVKPIHTIEALKLNKTATFCNNDNDNFRNVRSRKVA